MSSNTRTANWLLRFFFKCDLVLTITKDTYVECGNKGPIRRDSNNDQNMYTGGNAYRQFFFFTMSCNNKEPGNKAEARGNEISKT